MLRNQILGRFEIPCHGFTSMPIPCMHAGSFTGHFLKEHFVTIDNYQILRINVSKMYSFRESSKDIGFAETFYALYQHGQLTDCIIHCEGELVKCHKLVLVSSSVYFRELLLDPSISTSDYPLSIFKLSPNVKLGGLKAALEYMYRKDVKVHQSMLKDFLDAVTELQIRGIDAPSLVIPNENEPSGSGSSESSKLPNPETPNLDYSTIPSCSRLMSEILKASVPLKPISGPTASTLPKRLPVLIPNLESPFSIPNYGIDVTSQKKALIALAGSRSSCFLPSIGEKYPLEDEQHQIFVQPGLSVTFKKSTNPTGTGFLDSKQKLASAIHPQKSDYASKPPYTAKPYIKASDEIQMLTAKLLQQRQTQSHHVPIPIPPIQPVSKPTVKFLLQQHRAKMNYNGTGVTKRPYDDASSRFHEDEEQPTKYSKPQDDQRDNKESLTLDEPEPQSNSSSLADLEDHSNTNGLDLLAIAAEVTIFNNTDC